MTAKKPAPAAKPASKPTAEAKPAKAAAKPAARNGDRMTRLALGLSLVAKIVADHRGVVSYQPGAAGTFLRKWSTLEEPALDSQLDLFDVLPDEPQRDEIPVHYAQLAANPKPLAAKGKRR